MFSSKFSFLAIALLAISQICGVASSPVDTSGLSEKAREVLSRATQATQAPHWVIYSDKWQGSSLPAASAIKGYNVFLLSFWLVEGAWDNAQLWTTLSAAQRSSIKAEYAAAGIKLGVAAYGATDAPTSAGKDPVTLANDLAAWVKQWDLDGVDIDYEDFGAVDSGTASNWLISHTRQLRAQLPAGEYFLTHAPVAPWFSPIYANRAYLAVHAAVGDLIDWYNIQFYNQNEYTTCAGLLTTSTSQFPNSAVFQIAAAGVPLSKIVIGKPATTGDANNGYIDPSTLAGCLSQAKAKGWNGGAMVWQYPDGGSALISTVRSQSWPV